MIYGNSRILKWRTVPYQDISSHRNQGHIPLYIALTQALYNIWQVPPVQVLEWPLVDDLWILVKAHEVVQICPNTDARELWKALQSLQPILKQRVQMGQPQPSYSSWNMPWAMNLAIWFYMQGAPVLSRVSCLGCILGTATSIHPRRRRWYALLFNLPLLKISSMQFQ